ncbi:asparagine synthetase B, partial [Candidatus Parcubacteria bacterium]
MVDGLRHRGPDGSGIYVSKDGRVCLGHTRLAIVELSDAGHQPMVSGDDTVALTYNGEIYNHVELRQELQRLGAVFRGHSDTEVILEGYRAWGSGVVRRLRGMFAFAIYDSRRRLLLLARDRLGIKPLFFCHDGKEVVFGSEATVVRLAARRSVLDRVAVSGFVKYRFVPGWRSIW